MSYATLPANWLHKVIIGHVLREVQHWLFERSDEILAKLALLDDYVYYFTGVERVQSSIHLVEHTKRGGLAFLYRQNDTESKNGLLASRELAPPPDCLFLVETDFNFQWVTILRYSL